MISSDKYNLRSCLKKLNDGRIQLPDFQRDWKWDYEFIRQLLVSVSLGYPMGSILLLQTGNPRVKFKPRLIEGVKLDKEAEPEELILDGQQRLTALYQALMSGQAVTTKIKNKPIAVWYYINMKDAVDSSNDKRDGAIVGIKKDKKETIEGKKLDVSTPEKEYKEGLYPLAKIFHRDDWYRGYQNYWEEKSDKVKLSKTFLDKVISQSFEEYEIPYIKLDKGTPKPAISQIFLRVNRANEKLNIFDLLTAQFATENFNLRKDWEDRQKGLTKGSQKEHIFTTIDGNDFLKAVTLLATNERGDAKCKDADILELQLSDYQNWAERLQESLKKLERFLYDLKIWKQKDVSYPIQIISMAVAFVKIGVDNLKKAGVKEKIAVWYWCGVFGESYGTKVTLETAVSKDLKDVPDWVLSKTSTKPSIIEKAEFSEKRIVKLKTSNSAPYKGLCALLRRDGCQDFLTGETIDAQKKYNDKIDMHHIFPQVWCRKQNIPSDKYNSIINKTPLSATTNRKIGGQSPSDYLKKIMTEGNIERRSQMEKIVRSHNIDLEHLENNDFEQFFSQRKETLIKKVEDAMGQPIQRQKPSS